MAEEVVVREYLTPDMVAAGDDLTKRLRSDDNFHLICSLWLYASDVNRWQLVIATPLVETFGPTHVYRLIEATVGDNWPYSDAPLYEISILRSNHSLVQALRSLGHYETPKLPLIPEALSPMRPGKRITLSKVQDVFIEDALIYYIE